MAVVSNLPFSVAGVLPALVTPFTKDGAEIDTKSFGRLIDLQLSSGVSGVVVCGSTGESLTLSDSEYIDAVRFVCEQVAGKVPCIAGISASATARAVAAAKAVTEIGVDGVLVAAPPYNKPSQQGIIEHFRAIRAAAGLPIIAYNIPGRSSVAISSATLGQLAKDGTICGVKESSGSMDTVIDTIRSIGPDLATLSGEDTLVLGVLAYGGRGVISASANALPKEFVSICHSFESGDLNAAREVQLSIIPKVKALFVESNPVPVKAVLAMQGVISHATVRLPLVAMRSESVAVVREAFGL